MNVKVLECNLKNLIEENSRNDSFKTTSGKISLCRIRINKLYIIRRNTNSFTYCS